MKRKIYSLIVGIFAIMLIAPCIALGACENDLDGDGDVDGVDLAILAESAPDAGVLSKFSLDFAFDFGTVCEYPNSELLVSDDYLERMMELAQNLVVIDARGAGYDQAHIPGAISLKWQELGAPNLKSVSEVEQILTQKGIKRDFTFVIYDETTASWGAAGRIFCALEYLGCNDVHLLNGGWDKWAADNRMTETTANSLPALSQGETFIAEVKTDALATTDHVRDRRLDSDFVIIDSRTDEEFNGWTLYGEARGGHITGAVQIPYAWFFNKDKTILNSEDMSELFESKGVTQDKEVTSYCTAGIRSGFVYFALRLMGYQNASNYDASMYGWAAGDSVTYPMEKLANNEKVVHPAWVKDLIDGNLAESAKYVIAEVSWGAAGSYYNNGHIPGTIHINTDEIEYDYFEARNSGDVERSTTAEEDLAKGLTADDTLPKNWWNIYPDNYLLPAIAYMGIDKDTTVVIYGKSASAAARLVWTLMYAGVEDVRYLNGGYQAWTDAGYAGSTEAVERTPVASFGAAAALHPEYLVDIPFVRDVVNGAVSDAVMVDVRNWDEYRGATAPYSYIPTDGRVPGAVWSHWPSKGYVDADGTLMNPWDVKTMWDSEGATSDKHLSFYCGTAWRSSEAWFIAYMMGYSDISNFDSSWYEWSMGEGSAYNGADPVLNPIVDDAPGLP